MSAVELVHRFTFAPLKARLGPSAFSPLSLRHQRVVYSIHDGVPLWAELTRPRDERILPSVVLVHGGSWGGRSLADMRQTARLIASQGFVVLNVSYRFAPRFRYPAQLEDLHRAIHYLRAHAGDWQVDLERTCGWGYSAGGHLITQWALLESKRAGRPVFNGIVAGGTPFDLSWYPFSPIITHLLDGFRDQRLADYQQASPVNHVGPWAPPMFLYHAERDRLVEAVQSTHMQNLLRRHGVHAELHLLKWGGHIRAFLFGQSAVEKGIAFLKGRTGA